MMMSGQKEKDECDIVVPFRPLFYSTVVLMQSNTLRANVLSAWTRVCLENGYPGDPLRLGMTFPDQSGIHSKTVIKQ